MFVFFERRVLIVFWRVFFVVVRVVSWDIIRVDWEDDWVAYSENWSVIDWYS